MRYGWRASSPTKRAKRKLAGLRKLTLRVRGTATYPDDTTADLDKKRTTLRR